MKEWRRNASVHLTASLFFIFLLPVYVLGQQPFVTDDADTTDKGKFHLEVANEFDRLQPESLPLRAQNVTRATVAFGLAKNLEISVTTAFLILKSRERAVAGLADSTIGVKYNFLKEKEKSRRPALTISGFFQIPTGSSRRGLGSGVVDYGIVGIAQKTFAEKNVVRVNGGILFSGNTLTGALGIAVVRGNVYTGGLSYVRTINDKLQLGGEITTAVTSNFDLSKGQLQGQFGGNYQIGKNTTLDFGIISGRFSASPRLGFQLGFSHDF